MHKRYIINLTVAGVLSAAVLYGCGNSASSYYSQGVESFQDGSYTDAIENLQKAVDKDSDNDQYLTYLGLAQIQTGDNTSALETLQAAVEANSKNREAYRALGIANYQLNQLADAQENLQKSIDLSDGKYDEITMDDLNYLAMCQYKTSDFQGAVETYTTLLEQVSKSDKAQVYYLRGCSYIALKDEANAVLDFEASLKVDDDNYDMYCDMYSSFYNAGYQDRGESYLKRIVDLEDSDDLTIGKTYYILGDYEEAEKYLKDAVADHNEEALFYLAKTYAELEQYSDAEDLYKEGINDNPNDPDAYNQYGAYLMSRSDYSSALVYIETGLELKKGAKNQDLLYNQAVCYEYTQEFEKATDLFKTYLETYPDDQAAQKEYSFLLTR